MKITTLGSVTHSYTSDFQHAIFLNDPSIAYEVLDDMLGPGGWYPENTDCAWTDIAVDEGKYYAAFGEDSVMCSEAKMIYVEIKPIPSMIRAYETILEEQKKYEEG